MNLSKSQKITLIGALLLIGITYLVSIVIKNDIEKNAQLTVAYVYSYMNGPSSGPAVFYKYKVEGVMHENSDFLNSGYDVRVGEFYRVKYSYENPSLSELQQDYKVTDTIAIKKAGLFLPKKKKNQFQQQ